MVKSICENCGKTIFDKYYCKTRKYCSRYCQGQGQRKKHIELWLKGEISGIQKSGSCPNGKNRRYEVSDAVRYYLYETRGRKCEQCGWEKINPTTKKIPIQIHHKDGNTKNANVNNLIILCPNCHSLTPNWQSLNLKGREKRTNPKFKF